MKYRRVETPALAASSIRSHLAPMIVTAIGCFMILLDTPVVNAALPTIQNELGDDFCACGALPLGSRLRP